MQWSAPMGIHFYDSEIGNGRRKSNSPPCPRKERGDKDGAASLPVDLHDALFQHVHRDISFFFGDYQRRAQSDGTRPAA